MVAALDLGSNDLRSWGFESLHAHVSPLVAIMVARGLSFVSLTAVVGMVMPPMNMVRLGKW